MKADFDQAAPNYDSHFTFSEIGKMQRNLVYNQLQKQLKNTKKILEINCGTGEDAIWLAKQNFQVTATDISEKMIEVAQSKSNVEHLTFKVLDSNTLSEEREKYNFLFSNFGGLNCLTKQELALFFKSASEILLDKGKMSLVIMPKNTLWEPFYFLLKFNFKTAFRRKKEVVFANVEGEKVATYYYNPKDIVHLSQVNFEILEVKPIGFFIPPSYLEPFFTNKKILLKGLNFLENSIKEVSFLSKYADHYIITLQKK
jgi:ubiquinone/menaquinone biosynthesis C-methylase UbiE